MANQLLEILLSDILGKEADTGSSSQHKRELMRGDVICVREWFSSRYGIWTGKAVIMYGKNSQDIKDVHERSLKNFLHGAASYSICLFPQKYGPPRRLEHISPVQGFVMPQDKLWRMLEQAEKIRRYKRYSPEETAIRAEKAIGRRNFASNEHFAVWCKTGIDESHELEAMREAWDKIITY